MLTRRRFVAGAAGIGAAAAVAGVATGAGAGASAGAGEGTGPKRRYTRSLGAAAEPGTGKTVAVRLTLPPLTGRQHGRLPRYLADAYPPL